MKLFFANLEEDSNAAVCKKDDKSRNDSRERWRQARVEFVRSVIRIVIIIAGGTQSSMLEICSVEKKVINCSVCVCVCHGEAVFPILCIKQRVRIDLFYFFFTKSFILCPDS